MAGHFVRDEGAAGSNPVIPTRLCKKQSFFMPHYVYILQSEKDKRYYIGETADVNKRLEFHNKGFQRSTRNRVPFRLILSEEYATRTEALKREKQIKKWKGGR